MDYPLMIYRPGNSFRWEGRDLDYRIVDDSEEEAASRAKGWRRAAELLSPAPPANPLDHDGDGISGGSLPGEQSTRAKGARRKKAGQ